VIVQNIQSHDFNGASIDFIQYVPEGIDNDKDKKMNEVCDNDNGNSNKKRNAIQQQRQKNQKQIQN
jgi:hypothetical protein